MSSFQPKNEKMYFCNSALASKMGQFFFGSNEDIQKKFWN